MYQKLIHTIFEGHPPAATETLIAEIRFHLEQLAPIQQEIIRERYIKGQSVKVIALQKKYSESSIRRHLSIGLHQLRKLSNAAYREELQKVHDRFVRR